MPPREGSYPSGDVLAELRLLRTQISDTDRAASRSRGEIRDRLSDLSQSVASMEGASKERRRAEEHTDERIDELEQEMDTLRDRLTETATTQKVSAAKNLSLGAGAGGAIVAIAKGVEILLQSGGVG